jgi:hypothetical protein
MLWGAGGFIGAAGAACGLAQAFSDLTITPAEEAPSLPRGLHLGECFFSIGYVVKKKLKKG